VEEPWATGYGYSSKMSVTASSFDQPLTSTFKRIFAFRSLIQTPYKTIASWAADTRKAFSRFEPVIEQIVKIPITRLVDFLGSKIQTLQMGDIRMYCFYIVFTLAVLLIVIFK
jgi:hydrogenase-4 component B